MRRILLALAVMALFSGMLHATEMVRVEGGTFVMGSDYGDGDESPMHEVTLSPFMIGKYEVTVGEFRAFVEDTGYKTIAEMPGSEGSFVKVDDTWKLVNDAYWNNTYLKQNDRHPVTYISWYDAIVYCNWLSRKEGLTLVYTINKSKLDSNNSNNNDALKWSVICNWNANGYRLPTEAEWEFAARGGNDSKGYIYSGSNDINSVAWNCDNAGRTTLPVGTKESNELEIYDMSGNVWEWCWDWYGDYTESSVTDPTGASGGWRRVQRGGSHHYFNDFSVCRVTNRSIGFQDTGVQDYGFRVARSIK